LKISKKLGVLIEKNYSFLIFYETWYTDNETYTREIPENIFC